MIVGDFNLVFVLIGEVPETPIHPVLMNVCNGNQLYTFARAQRLVRRPRATSTAADQRDFDRIAGRYCPMRKAFNRQCAQCGCASDRFGSVGKEISTSQCL